MGLWPIDLTCAPTSPHRNSFSNSYTQKLEYEDSFRYHYGIMGLHRPGSHPIKQATVVQFPIANSIGQVSITQVEGEKDLTKDPPDQNFTYFYKTKFTGVGELRGTRLPAVMHLLPAACSRLLSAFSEPVPLHDRRPASIS